MKNVLLAILVIVFTTMVGFAQNGVQNVKGQIIDKQSEIPLIGAMIKLISEDAKVVGAVTDYDGNFVINDIPVGRHAFEVSYLGYESMVIPNVELTSEGGLFKCQNGRIASGT